MTLNSCDNTCLHKLKCVLNFTPNPKTILKRNGEQGFRINLNSGFIESFNKLK